MFWSLSLKRDDLIPEREFTDLLEFCLDKLFLLLVTFTEFLFLDCLEEETLEAFAAVVVADIGNSLEPAGIS